MKRFLLALLATMVFSIGCNTLNTTVVTLTEVEDSIMKEWATLHNDGKTTADLDLKVMTAHSKFNESKLAAATALRAYAAGSDKAEYLKLLETARASISPLLQLISPLLTSAKSENLTLRVVNANAP